MKIHRRILAAMTALALAAGMIFCCACSDSKYTASDAKAFWDTIEETPLEDFEYEYSGNSYKIHRYKGNDEIVKIPAEKDGIPVSCLAGTIDYEAYNEDKKNHFIAVFENNSTVKEVFIPEDVYVSTYPTFNNCASLCEIYFPSTYQFPLNNNGMYTYFKRIATGCPNLSSIIIPEEHPDCYFKDGVVYIKPESEYIDPDSNVRAHGASAAVCMIESKSMTLADGITEIGFYAFSECDLIESVTIPSSVKEIRYGAFCKCDNLSSVTIPEGVETIQAGAFADCPKLTEISLPSSIKKLEPISGENDDLVINYNGKSYSAKTDRNALIEAIRANNPNG